MFFSNFFMSWFLIITSIRKFLIVLLTVSPYLTLVYYTMGTANLKISKTSYIPKLQRLVLSPHSGMDREPDVVQKDDSQTFVCDSTLTRLIAVESFSAGGYERMVEFDFWQERLEFSRHHSSDILSTFRQLAVISNWFRSSFHRVPRWPSEREINPPASY